MKPILTELTELKGENDSSPVVDGDFNTLTSVWVKPQERKSVRTENLNKLM